MREMRWMTALALLAALAAPVGAATIGRDGLGFECGDIAGGFSACCDIRTLGETDLATANRPMRVAECLHNESFFVRIPFFPSTSGRNWEVQLDCSLNAATSAECCFDMTTSVTQILTSSERDMLDAGFGNEVEIPWAATLDVTSAYNEWLRSSATAFIPYHSATAASCANPPSNCRNMPVWLKFTRDDSNTGCDIPAPGVKAVVSNVLITTD